MIGDNAALDLLRAFTILVAGALVAYTLPLVLHWRRMPYDLGRKYRYLALLGYGILTALDSVHELGQPAQLWRCPALFIVSVAALFGMMLPEIDEWKDRPRWWDFDTPADKYREPKA